MWKYGGEHWCNLQGRYVTLHRDYSSWTGGAFDITICNFNIYGGKYTRTVDKALPAKVTVEQGASYTLNIKDLSVELIFNTVNIEMALATPEEFRWVTLIDKDGSTDVVFAPTTLVAAKEYTITFYNIDSNSPLTEPATLKTE